jgi:hypothetical protein
MNEVSETLFSVCTNKNLKETQYKSVVKQFRNILKNFHQKKFLGLVWQPEEVSSLA